MFPHTKMGWIPFNGATQILPRIIGKSRALELLLADSVMEVDKAYENGLIHYIVHGSELQTTITKMAAKMAVNSPISLKYTKETVTKGLDMTLEQGLRLEADMYFLMHSADDRTEGINAFKEKRKPIFKGQ
jgi:enoyl-CoA hydratase/carnithine racemase